ncbi:hypothetical protein [Yoonia sp.]|uniref:hypothetical protein n=1 Tax=Yoonia sp. TaxID=2212373 RepID=UPI00391D2722
MSDKYPAIIGGLCNALDMPSHTLPAGLRIRDSATHRFVFNYAPRAQVWGGNIVSAASVYWEAL